MAVSVHHGNVDGSFDVVELLVVAEDDWDVDVYDGRYRISVGGGTSEVGHRCWPKNFVSCSSALPVGSGWS